MRMTFRREAKQARKQSRRQAMVARGALSLAALFALSAPGAQAISASPAITADNWGAVTAPVFNQAETNSQYAGTFSFNTPDLFAGPAKFGDGNYYHGVIPNGKVVNPAGKSVQVGMNPLGSALTPDGQYLITTNDDERENYSAQLDSSLQSSVNKSAYSLSVIRTSDMTVVSQTDITLSGSAGPNRLFVGLQVKANTGGGYTLYASGGPNNNVKTFSITAGGTISTTPTAAIAIAPILPGNQGYASNYTPAAALNTADGSGNKPPIPSAFSRTANPQITFPAGSALSPDGRYLYVACNGDNSLAVIDTTSNAVVKRVAVGYFPYGVSVSRDGTKVLVSNWGVTAYKFLPSGTPGATGTLSYDGSGNLAGLARISPVVGSTRNPGDPDTNDYQSLFFTPVASDGGSSPQTSSVSVISVPGGNGAAATLLGSLYEGQPGGLTADQAGTYNPIGETHPSATAIVRKGALEVLYVCKANSDSIGKILITNNRNLGDTDLSLFGGSIGDHAVHGAYPNAIVVSPDNTRAYVAEAGLNSVAILDTTSPAAPKLIGRIPTGWYPTALAISPDGQTLYVANAKGVGEDINPRTSGNPTATGVASFPGSDFKSNGVDSNYVFGSVQQVAGVRQYEGDTTSVLANNYAVQPSVDTSIVPMGGAASTKIKHVFFIEQENKTFDSVLGSQGHFGPFASGTYNNFDGTPYNSTQFTGVVPNFQALANLFAVGVNYYSDSEESDAGHQFCASGTASDYTEKTLLVKSGRGLLVNKNFEPEDYPEAGYLFDNAARNGVSFKDYGELIRIDGTDTGTTVPTTIDDPKSGNLGYPKLNADGVTITNPLVNAGDVDSTTVGLGQSYFLNLPILQVLGTTNGNGEGRIDRNYPGYNFNISDQRRAKEFMADFDRMANAGTLPTFLYIYLPNNHTGGAQAPNAGQVVTSGATSPFQQVADNDTGLGMVIKHIMSSPVYYSDPNSGGDGTGSAIFITEDDAQSTLDHIHPHRTPMMVVSPFAKVTNGGQSGQSGYIGTHHYVTASIVKTEELLLGLPPLNLGDLFATDLRDMFQSTYNGITAANFSPTRVSYVPSPEGVKVWKLVAKLDTHAPDTDSKRLGLLVRLTGAADVLHRQAARKRHLHTAQYRAAQARIYQMAVKLVGGPAPRDTDD